MKCAHCGSPLVVKPAKAFAACEYCGKSTRVRGAETLMAEQGYKPTPAPAPVARAYPSYASSPNPTRRGSSSPVSAGGCLAFVAVGIGLAVAVFPMLLTDGLSVVSSLPFFQEDRPPAPVFVLTDSESHRMDGVADGSEPATSIANLTCAGYLHAAPDLRVQTPSAGVVHLDVTGSGDLTLAVHLSDGRWLCDDDSGDSFLPRIVEQFPVGEHQVYVGRFSSSAEEPFALMVSEDMPSLPRPQASLEDKPEEPVEPRHRRRAASMRRHHPSQMTEEPPEEIPVVGAIPVAPRPSQPSEIATRGMLSVHTTPWSSVRINGRIVGNTPRTNLIVPVGRVRVEVQREGRGDWETLSIEVHAGQPARLTHRF